MEFRPLRAFVEVVRSGGFSPAARVLNATQPTVSKAVKQLEDEVGIPLLDRIGHRAVLTAAGEAVFRRGIRLLADRDDLLAELAEIRGLRRGVLRLGLPPVGSSTLFAPLVAAYRRRHPGIELRLAEHGSDLLEEKLRAGEIDFAGALLPTSDEFDWQLVRCEPLVALLPAQHRLATRATLAIEELRETPFILFDSGFTLQRIVLEACRQAGFDPEIAVRSTQIDFMVELVRAGLGVAFLPRLIAAAKSDPGLKAVLLEGEYLDWNMAMVWRRGAYVSHAAAAWLDCVREESRRPDPSTS
ncbi:LysR family transcriptional regulator [Ancylobacter terrae]|uniref:LysR family transcriptional regulator n=1 Tax=Ancylobacter sp. sgz301288 TaxID=3342077 RepID=UPI0038598CF3